MLRRRHYRRASPGSIFSFVILVFILLLLVEGLLTIQRRIAPAILAAAVMECDGIATMAINRVILDEVIPTVSYKDLLIVEKDETGKIVMAQVNTVEINRIMALTTAATGQAVTNISEREIKIPLGKISGLYYLASYGPKIPVKMKPINHNRRFLDR